MAQEVPAGAIRAVVVWGVHPSPNAAWIPNVLETQMAPSVKWALGFASNASTTPNVPMA